MVLMNLPEMLSRLPRELFWDVDPEKLDLHRHARFMIERVLQFGQPEQVRWLLDVFPEAEIREAVKCSRTLDRKTAHFWAIHYGIPIEEVRCLQKPFPRPF